MSAVDAATAVLDRSASLQQGTKHFSALYERNAYVVYNLSLRITCDRAVAIESARTAFLTALAAAQTEDGLSDAAVRQALAVAGDRPATPNGAGDAEAEAMLAATATLTPPERAALALTGLLEAHPASVATTLNVSEHVAESIVERAFAALAGELGTQPGETRSAYRAWLLVEPPQELWETLYPDFYRALERTLREGQDGAPSPGVAGRPSRRARRRARRATRRAAAGAPGATDRRPRRWRRRVSFGVAILAIAAGGFVAAERTGLITSSTGESAQRPPEPPSTFGSGLSPTKLDRLRMREIAKTRDYAASKVASAREKRDAAARRKAARAARQRKAKAALEKQKKLARRRKQAALRRRRENAARLQQLRQQQQQQQQASAPKPPRRPHRPTRGNSTSQPGGGNPSNNSNPATGTPHNDNNQPCILNQENGTYICPQ